MHADQVEITTDVVAALVAAQFPDWSALPVRPVTSYGTVNALFRLGEDIVLRFPLQPNLDPELRDDLLTEQANARRIAAYVSVAVPEPLAIGEPGEGYGGPWTAYRWIPGETASAGSIGDRDVFARDLAGFVTALHGIDTGGRKWAGHGRGGPLRTKDDYVRDCLARSGHLTDTATLARIWADCLDAPANDGDDVWIHADLMPGNILVRDGRLAAVIDLGAVYVGDPAADLQPAWNLLGPGARESYRRALGVDEATWRRGRGWALLQAIGALWYYVDTNPVMADTARHTLDALLE
ncbi:aminoglycoside phosphotransferase family protein [Micromonospora sp. NBC_01796]|uniref:aminoglycoside phosphotransferase family protein n=1 Tax=Micromonospora sp. NBC_01796 TaxID=2975987 RepID=UPI002DDA368C|nr:aminoglycoside phosphotransferase family protein [Micromonospora sp. NBC_01796]WSA89714.1 aminoglycoside phosphotransferase family protein [Micromonospora sp. NBC_01796]